MYQAAEILSPAVNQRVIDFHLSRFNLPLGRAELAPGCRVRPQGRGRSVVTDQAQSLHSRQPVTPKRVPSVIITALVLGDQVRRRLQRRMRRRESQIGEEWLRLGCLIKLSDQLCREEIGR